MAAVIEFRLTGGASNNDPDVSLGGVMSSHTLSETPMNNLFDNVLPEEADNGDTEYRAIDLYNSGDAAATAIEMYMSSETTSTDTHLEFGTNNTPHDGSDQGDTIADESTAPSGITFDHHLTGNRLSLTDIPAGQAIRVWISRVVAEGAANTNNDTGTIAVDYA